jgi:hypothetical protein
MTLEMNLSLREYEESTLIEIKIVLTKKVWKSFLKPKFSENPALKEYSKVFSILCSYVDFF